MKKPNPNERLEPFTLPRHSRPAPPSIRPPASATDGATFLPSSPDQELDLYWASPTLKPHATPAPPALDPNTPATTATTPPALTNPDSFQPSTRSPQLAPEQLRAIDLILLGKSDTRVAHALGLHRVTITRWRLYHPVFRAEISRRRLQRHSNVADLYRSLLCRALKQIHKALRSDDDVKALRTARALVSPVAHKLLPPPNDPTHPDDVLFDYVVARRQLHVQNDVTRIAMTQADKDRAQEELLYLAQSHPINEPPPAERPPAFASHPYTPTTPPDPQPDPTPPNPLST